MSDLDDEILELAGAGEKKRRKPHSSKPSKRRKEDHLSTTESERTLGREEDEEDPYPLEGKYRNESDRQHLLQMSEVEREDILAQRLEEKQQLLDKRLLSQMVQQQRGGGEDSVAKAAKRQHTARGATKEKTNGLAELKARRKAKDERKRHSSPKRDRSSSPMDMEISDGESEDGQITKLEQEEEKVGRIFSKPLPESEPITMGDLERCRLTRDLLLKHALAPWFEDYVKGAWVRYLVGNDDDKQPVYRICEIQAPAADFVKTYKIDDKPINQALDLKLGKSVRTVTMDKVSNGCFTPKEFEFWKNTLDLQEIKLPTKREIEQKNAQLHKLPSQPVTESDINAMLARKSQLQPGKSSGKTVLEERSSLNTARTLALRRNDLDEVALLDAQLVALGTSHKPQETEDIWAKVNERNRRANMEAVRKAEIAEAGRKRKERKLAAAGTPVVVHDPSARLKTVPRMFNSATPTTSRPGTPSVTPQPSQPVRTSPLPPSALSGKGNDGAKTFEALVIDAVDVDLGDF